MSFKSHQIWAGLLILIHPLPSQAKNFISLEEGLALAFPGCLPAREAVYLTTTQSKAIDLLSGVESSGSLIIRYRCTVNQQLRGFAYTDTHRVRTHPETILVAVDANGEAEKVELLSFDEPEDYIPKRQWYGWFKGIPMGEELALKKSIPFVTGASLTTRATTSAVRRVLSIHRILAESKP